MADGGSPAQLMTSLDATAGHDLDRLAQVLAASKEFRVLRRLQRRDRYHSTDGAATRLALFVDVETTGLACDRDRVIELAAVPFDYGLVTAEIYTVHEPVTYLEDPEKAIAPEITALTGITTAMVRGHRIDDAVINALVSSASLVIAHNADFDRKFLERRLPIFARKPWACSYADVPWRQFGCQCRSLEYLTFKRCHEFYDGHRAVDDCIAGIHNLAMPFPCGTTPFQVLLDTARTVTARIWARDAPFACSSLLRARGYKWRPRDVRPGSWYRDCEPHTVKDECEWLRVHVYRHGKPGWIVQKLSAFDRYSSRA